MMNRRRYGFALLLCTVASASRAQTPVIDVNELSLHDAVELGLQHHPSIRTADAARNSATAGLRQASSAWYPVLGLSASASRTDGAFVFNPSFPPRTQTYNNYTTTLQFQQTVFDFGRTIGRVAAGSALEDAATADLAGARATVAMNVQIAYFGVLQAAQVVRVNEQTVEQATSHLKRAQAFYSVGRRPQLDVTRAEVDLANANVNVIRARNQASLARLQLENAMGVRIRTTYGLTDSLAAGPFDASLDSAKAIALRQRPEIGAARLRIDAARSLVTAAWSQHLPSLSAFGTWTWSGFDFPLASRWNAGFTVSIPVFQGFALDAQVDQARAAEEAAHSGYDQLTESVLFDVEQNFLLVNEASERLAAAAKLVEQADQNLILAEKQYAAGVGTPIETTDAQVQVANAHITSIQALYDYNSSLVRLHRSMGGAGE